MIKSITLSKSDAKNKKYKVVIIKQDGSTKTINFGDNRYEDFTIHKDEQRKRRYFMRHGDTKDLESAKFWSNNILWNKRTISDSIRDTERRFGINIKH